MQLNLFVRFCFVLFCHFAVHAAEESTTADAPLPLQRAEQMQPLAAPGVGAPSSITYSTSTSTTGIYTVTWGAAANADSYYLEESVNSGSYQQVAETASFNRSYTPATAKANGNYVYRVRGCDISEQCGAYKTGGTLTVAVPPSPTATLSAAQTNIAYNQSTTLTWTSGNATSCTLNGGAVALSGNQSSGPLTSDKDFSLVCVGAGGSVNKNVRVTVIPQPTITTFTASPSTIAIGNSSTLSWATSNANSCVLNGQTVASSGTQTTGSLSTNQTYSLSCSGVSGSSSPRSVTVTVVQAWANVGSCDETTGKQLQICVQGSLCTLNSTRQISACTVPAIDCTK